MRNFANDNVPDFQIDDCVYVIGNVPQAGKYGVITDFVAGTEMLYRITFANGTTVDLRAANLQSFPKMC